MNTFTLVAEIGCTHIGDMDRAKRLIKLAKDSGADVAKFQKRNPKECVPQEWWNKPHPNERFAYGKTYLEHRENLELNVGQHAELKKYCESIGITYSTSVWDLTSAKEIINLKPDYIKIPSACNNNWNLINYIYDNYDGDVHISLGMMDKNDFTSFFDHYYGSGISNSKNRLRRTVSYHCVSGYPVPFEKMFLKEISKLQNFTERIGFSNHGYGIAMEPVAYTLGARWFERHFIDDRSFPHTDASASVEPQGLLKIKRDLNAIEKALQFKPEKLDPMELEQRNKLRS